MQCCFEARTLKSKCAKNRTWMGARNPKNCKIFFSSYSQKVSVPTSKALCSAGHFFPWLIRSIFGGSRMRAYKRGRKRANNTLEPHEARPIWNFRPQNVRDVLTEFLKKQFHTLKMLFQRNRMHWSQKTVQGTPLWAHFSLYGSLMLRETGPFQNEWRTRDT